MIPDMFNLHKHFTVSLFFIFTVTMLGATSSHAGLYLKPRVGVTTPVKGGDPYYSLGASAGYQWVRLFGTEVTYTRLVGYGSNSNGNTYRAQGVFTVPVGIITPFATAGVGYFDLDTPGYDSQVVTIVGGGISLSKILFFTASIGADYIIVADDQRDYIEPYIALGVSF